MDDLFDVFDEKPAEDGLTSLAEGATTGTAAKKRKTESGEQNSTDSVEQVSKVIEDDELRDAARPPALPASGPASGAGEGGQPAMASSSSSSSSAASSTAATTGSTLSNDAGEAEASGASALSKGDVDEGKTTALDDRLPDNPARKYPFSLDPFQRRSIACLERNESVMVSAHTSAGKTVVAEYAIAMALRDGQRVIYTSPIKALSNQKYREMVEEFKDVGLMTGDVTIAPQAACLVMTTEILRSMLYRGSEVIKAVKWVIFDEIHYMRDKERGVVWEESIIMLPDTVRFVFLSATIPNAKEFAAWTRHLHHHTCHVVYTDYRPTPLQHFIFPAGGEGVYLVVDEKGRFRSDNFEQAMARLKTSAIEDAVEASEGAGGAGGRKRKRKPQGGKNGTPDLQRLIRMVMQRGYDPVIVFSFSKRDCEKYALQLARLDFTTDEEKQLTERVFKAAISALSEDDRALPQIEALLPLLKRGVGIHHGGLLPILKEVVEILFQESLVKILFATETFAMGVNMPAKTVIFTGLRKFDGNSFRLIRPGEYIQMSGRAGRRGLDDRGIVIYMVDEAMEPEGAKEILRGQADPLDSSFHLSYNMLLNLMRVEAAGVDPESIMQQSFHQFQNERAVPEMEKALAVKHKEAGEVEVQEESETRKFHVLCERLEDRRGLMRDMAMQPSRTVKFLAPGRLVRVRDGVTDWGWGVVSEVEAREGAFLRERERRLAMGEGEGEVAGGSGAGAGAATGESSKKDKKKRKRDKKKKGKGGKQAGGGGGDVSLADLPASDVVVKAVLLTMADSRHLAAKLGAGTVDGTEAEGKARRGGGAPQPCGKKAARAGEGRPRVLPVLLSAVEALSKVRVYLTGGKEGLAEGKGGKPGKGLSQVGEKLTEVLRRFDGAPPLLDPRKDLGLAGEPAFEAVYEEAAGVEAQLRDCAAMQWSKPDRRERVAALKRKDALVEQTRFLERQIRSSKALVMRDTLRKMKRVLRRLDYVDDKGVVQLKGRVACEVNTADELLVTELIFSGTFSELDEGQVASLLSCAVFGEGSSTDAMEDAELPPRLAGPVRTLREAARRIGDVSAESLIEIDVEEYVKSFRVDMMPVVDAWAAGKKFKEVMKLTKLFEGSVIRVIRRLEELLRQLAEAARGVGEEALEAKFKGASAKMRRDIVFAASLYV